MAKLKTDDAPEGKSTSSSPERQAAQAIVDEMNAVFKRSPSFKISAEAFRDDYHVLSPEKWMVQVSVGGHSQVTRFYPPHLVGNGVQSLANSLVHMYQVGIWQGIDNERAATIEKFSKFLEGDL